MVCQLTQDVQGQCNQKDHEADRDGARTMAVRSRHSLQWSVERDLI